MSSRNHMHVEFTNRGETIVAFNHDRGLLKTNGYGDYFFRGTTDNRFCCCSPELERKLIDMGIRAGERVGIKKSTRNRIVIWQVRRLDAPIAQPEPQRFQRTRQPIPDCKYSEPPVPVFPEVDEPAPSSSRETTPAPAQAVSPRPATAASQHITESDNLLGRCLCEALDACKAAQAHAAAIGLPTVFGAGEVERMGVSIFIERTRNGAVYERKPAGQQYSNGKANGHANIH